MKVAVVSKGRPASTHRMSPLLAELNETWFVPEGEGGEYHHVAGLAGLDINLVEVPVPTDGAFMLPRQRNAVLDWAGDDIAVQFNDDLTPWRRSPTGLSLLCPDGSGEVELSAAGAIAAIIGSMREHEAHFGGIAPTTNKFFYNPNRPVGAEHFIMAQLMVIDPTDVRFDEQFGTKEDYDFGMQHLYRYGAVARADRVLGNFKHFEKQGGCGLERTTEFDTEMARRLMAKWPDDYRLNPRRPGEVLQKWKGGRA